MSARKSVVDKFRREHAASIVKLLPHAVAYSVALAEGCEASCDAALDCLAQTLVDEFRLPRSKRVLVADVVSIDGGKS